MLPLVCILGAFQLTLIAAAFAFGRSRPRRVFALLAGTVALVVAGAALMESSAIESVPHFARVHLPLNYAIAPLFYLFILASIDKRPRRPWIHAVLPIAVAVTLVPFYASSAAHKLAAISSPDGGVRMRLIALLIEAAVYLALTVRALAPQRERHRTLWFATATLGLFWVVAGLRLTGVISPLVVPAGFSGLAALFVVALLRKNEPPLKYARSTLREGDSSETLTKLIAWFESEKPYLRADLTLETVAARVALSPNHLSQVVNQRAGRNFNEWVNAYRIGEARRMLVDKRYSHLSIAGIADAAGFGAKSTFNAAFKKETGLTPSEYRRRRTES